MQVTFIGFVVCLVLSVALRTEAQLVLEEDPEPEEKGGSLPRPRPGNCYVRFGNITAHREEEAELLKLAKSLTNEEDTTLSKVAVANIRPGQCLLQRRSTYIYRYLNFNNRKVRCWARISLSNCLGYCRSYQSVSPYNGYVSKYCACCQAIRHQTVTQYVTLYCDNNCNYRRYRHTSIQPASCRCRSC